MPSVPVPCSTPDAESRALQVQNVRNDVVGLLGRQHDVGHGRMRGLEIDPKAHFGRGRMLGDLDQRGANLGIAGLILGHQMAGRANLMRQLAARYGVAWQVRRKDVTSRGKWDASDQAPDPHRRRLPLSEPLRTLPLPAQRLQAQHGRTARRQPIGVRVIGVLALGLARIALLVAQAAHLKRGIAQHACDRVAPFQGIASPLSSLHGSCSRCEAVLTIQPGW
ncbi:MAG: hypothetical protein OET79_12710, partial [Nitrospirota bacterium]|nr:hypothetical protein [Nitrospirota bacterium]